MPSVYVKELELARGSLVHGRHESSLRRACRASPDECPSRSSNGAAGPKLADANGLRIRIDNAEIAVELQDGVRRCIEKRGNIRFRYAATRLLAQTSWKTPY